MQGILSHSICVGSCRSLYVHREYFRATLLPQIHNRMHSKFVFLENTCGKNILATAKSLKLSVSRKNLQTRKQDHTTCKVCDAFAQGTIKVKVHELKRCFLLMPVKWFTELQTVIFWVLTPRSIEHSYSVSEKLAASMFPEGGNDLQY